MGEVEIFYRLFAVREDGGTQADCKMLEVLEVPKKVAYWLEKHPEIISINIVRVKKIYV